MKVHCDEGVANHIGPEPCVANDEASVGESIGQPLSRERPSFRVPTPFCLRKATQVGATARAPIRPGVVEEPDMCRRRSPDSRARAARA